MSEVTLVRTVGFLSLAWLCCAAQRPKVIFVAVLDDFGYSSASFNQASPTWETSTPHMDAMAHAGVILERAYSHSFCSPTRSSFLSGRLPVHVQVSNVQPDQPNAGVPAAMTTLPQKLSAAGWSCHVAGKWDTGAATFAHTPEGRGYNSSLVYFSHSIDYFSHHDYVGTPTQSEASAVDKTPACADCMMCDDRYIDLWDTGSPARNASGTAYIDDLLLQRALHVISTHDFSSAPLFLHYTPHATHDPIQVPKSVLDRFANTTDDEGLCNASLATSTTGTVYPGFPRNESVPCRRVFEALVSVLDRALGSIQNALIARGVWNETLMVVFSDNGGQPDLTYGGGNNSPLRGGKGSEFEGGYRVASFVTGGIVPLPVRGSRQPGIVHVADWLGTLCTIADAGLPPIDSLNVWPLISGANATSPRTEFAASTLTLITTDWKLIDTGASGHLLEAASWQGSLWPNSSSPNDNVENSRLDCSASNGAGGACLFSMTSDASEHVNVAAQQPEVVADLRSRLATLWRPFFYSNNETAVCRRNASLPINNVCACEAAANEYNGYFGPYALPLP